MAEQPLASGQFWVPHRYDRPSGAIEFIDVDLETLRAATFLDDQNLANRPRKRVALGDFDLAASQGAVPIHFIFHTAFCCSTLMARTIDMSGAAIALREPLILNDLAEAALENRLDIHLLDLVLTLMSGISADGSPLVIKPSNEANILIGPLLSLRPSARALLLSSSLPDFLSSITKKGLWGRLWARRVFSRMNGRYGPDLGFSLTDMFLQTDLQVAALVWLFYRAEFARVTAGSGDRIRTLDSAVLLKRREAAFDSLAHFFSLTPKTGGAEVFQSHSKDQSRDYDPGAREAEQAEMRKAHGEEIDMICRWAEQVAAHQGIDTTLKQPLLGG